MMKNIIIDNNDSFTRNLEHLLALSAKGKVEITPYALLPGLDPNKYGLAVISPGPGNPGEYPGYARLLDSGLPVLGVCLGMQIINEHFKGQTARLPGCVHGKTESIEFAGRTFTVARYHSLYLSRVARDLEVIAANEAGVPMAVKHKTRKILGLQFHPESFLTPKGPWFIHYALDFLGLC